MKDDEPSTRPARVVPQLSCDDVAGCLNPTKNPKNLDIDPEFAPGVYQAGGAHVEAVSAAMCDAGYDVNAYELNCALDAAMSEPVPASISNPG